MMSICRRYTKNTEEAEEVLINGFVKIFKNISNYTGKGNFEGWMKRIIVNEALNYQKQYKAKWDRVSLLESDAKTNLSTSDEAEDLLKILQSLPSGYQTVFNLYAVEGYKHKEIAKMLNISENTSKSQLRKAKAMLQKIIKNES
jgi:RNA polymerase sigma-70 factor (ECF subfamily)